MANEFIARNGVIALANSTVSGSLSVTNSVSGSVFTGSFVGELTGTSSYASFANTASFATLAYSASYFSGSISNAVFATSASFAATASYALNAGAGGGGTVGGQALLTQSLAATTWSFNHNLGTTYPVITVYDGPSNSVIQPLNIVSSGSNNINIFFSSPKSGYATAVAGGGYFVTNNGTTRKLVQSTPAVTWSFVHNIGDQYPAFEIYDSNNNIVIPANIRAVDAYTAEIQFAYSASGTAVATLGGGIGVGDVITIPSASSNWSIQHNLNTTYPIVTIWESGSNQIVQPDTISSVDANNILVTFTTPVKGFANVSRAGSVISGSTDWNLLINKPNVGVVYSQTTPSATWSISHNLGTQFPLVTVYDSSNAVVLPQSIVGTDANNITITFPTAQTGTVNVSKAGNYISGSILWSNITSGPFSTTGSITRFTGSLIITGSLTVSGSGTFNNVGPANFTGSLNVTGSLNTIGTITATTLVVQTITSSISSITGSTNFGSLSSNTHQFTGSMLVSGSTTALNVNSGMLFVSSSGNVGISTTNPTSPLTVKAGSRSDTLRLTISGSSSVSDAVGITFGSANYDKAQIIAYNENVGNASGYLTFWTGGTPATTDMTERVRITSGGSVLIGTTTQPSAIATSDLLVIGKSGNTSNAINFSNGITTNWGYLLSQSNKMVLGSGTSSDIVFETNAGSERMRISSTGVLTHNASGVSTIVLGASANYTNISSGGYGATLYMNGATRGGGTTGANGAVVLATDGAFYVTDSTTNTIKFQVRGDGLVATGLSTYSPYNFSLTGRDCYINSSGELGYLSSIRESKININNIENVNWLLNLNPVSFNKRKKDEEGKFIDEFYNELDYGLIAEEAELINDQICFYDETEEGKIIRGVSYTKLITPMLKAIQELTARVQELENK